MNILNRLRAIAGKIDPRPVPETHIIEVLLYKGDTEAKALTRYKKQNKVNKIDNIIYINVPSNKSIKARYN